MQADEANIPVLFGGVLYKKEETISSLPSSYIQKNFRMFAKRTRKRCGNT